MNTIPALATEDAPRRTEFDATLVCKKARNAFRVAESMLRNPRPWTVAEIAAAHQLDPAAAQRLLNAGIEVGWIAPSGGGYVITNKLREVHRDFLRAVDRSINELHRIRSAHSVEGE